MSLNNYSFQFRKRSWWQWLVAAIWLFALLFFLNLGISSTAELEPQASLIGYVAALVLLIIGVAAYLFENRRAQV